MGAGRDVWVKIRASEAERAEWHAKTRSAGLTLSDLVRRSVGQVRTWTVAHAEVERERTRQVARIGNNLNQIARWANTHASAAEGVEVLRGDPHQVAAVADAQIGAVLDAFERTAWRGLNRTATPGRPCCTASEAAVLTCTSSPRGATSRPAGASTSRLRAGGRRSIRSATPSTPKRAGAGRTTRRWRGCSSPGTGPMSSQPCGRRAWRCRARARTT